MIHVRHKREDTLNMEADGACNLNLAISAIVQQRKMETPLHITNKQAKGNIFLVIGPLQDVNVHKCASSLV